MSAEAWCIYSGIVKSSQPTSSCICFEGLWRGFRLQQLKLNSPIKNKSSTNQHVDIFDLTKFLFLFLYLHLADLTAENQINILSKVCLLVTRSEQKFAKTYTLLGKRSQLIKVLWKLISWEAFHKAVFHEANVPTNRKDNPSDLKHMKLVPGKICTHQSGNLVTTMWRDTCKKISLLLTSTSPETEIQAGSNSLKNVSYIFCFCKVIEVRSESITR